MLVGIVNIEFECDLIRGNNISNVQISVYTVCLGILLSNKLAFKTFYNLP